MLINRPSEVQMEPLARHAWENRTTPAQRRLVATYERDGYGVTDCVGHIDHKDRMFIRLERWTDYPNGRRDIQRMRLLVRADGKLLDAWRERLESVRLGEAAAEVVISPAAFPGDVEEVAEPPCMVGGIGADDLEGLADSEPPKFKAGDRVRFEGGRHDELAGSEGEVQKIVAGHALVWSDELSEVVTVPTAELIMIEPAPQRRRPRKMPT